MSFKPRLSRAGSIGQCRLNSGEFIAAVIGFGVARPPLLDAACPFTTVEMEVLGEGPPYEVWTSSEPVEWHSSGQIVFAKVCGSLFGLLAAPHDSTPVEHFARTAYERIFAIADAHSCPNLLRVYNYIADITGLDRGIERYRWFNEGRHEAFVSAGRAVQAAPAACALGSGGDSNTIYFLASANPGVAIANPRQMQAFDYPPRYGRRSPTFSRALVGELPGAASFFVSGTASIVGHESLHEGDVAAQVDETLTNMDALCGACGDFALDDIADRAEFKVYVRNVQDLGAIARQVEGRLGNATSLYLRAEICRPELLVEIEAFCDLEPSLVRACRADASGVGSRLEAIAGAGEQNL